MFSIIMMSCDKYKCLTPAFNHCLDCYYPNHPQINYVYGNGCWTQRLREELEYLVDDYVLVMLDDMLIREPVNEELIKDAIKVLDTDPTVAVINFEKNYRPADFYSNNWLKQKDGQLYLHSCQPSLWRRTALIENLNRNEDAWSWEMTWVSSNKWKYLINNNAEIINIGRTNDLNWGIARGKITEEFKKFLIWENIYTKEIEETFSHD